MMHKQGVSRPVTQQQYGLGSDQTTNLLVSWQPILLPEPLPSIFKQMF